MKRLTGYSVEVCVEGDKKYARHQIETAEKLSGADAVFNTYPTGTGKTRALLNAIRKLEIERALVVAPINELIHQYRETVQEFVDEHAMPHKVHIITSESLDRMNPSSHSRALKDILENKKEAIIITNPDIVFYVLMQRFGHSPAVQRPLIVDLFLFPQLVAFDEFHYYDPSRIFFAIVLVATAKKFGLQQKYLLMTATPNGYLLDTLRKNGVTVEVVEFAEHFERETIPAASPIDVEVLEGNLDTLKEKLCILVREHLKEHRDILVISDSLARIIKFGRTLREMGIDFGMVTGPMDSERRREALQKRLVLATPTVDIGYDFSRPLKERQSIDTVIFEARESDTLIQRLGRAGRVFGKNVTDQPSYAYLLIPPRWFGRVKEALERSSTRLEFAEELKKVLPGSLESLKKEYLGPYRLVLGFYESAFLHLFPKDSQGLLNEYFNILEAMLGLNLKSRNLWRNELDFYYFLCKKDEKGNGERLLDRNPSLREILRERYKSYGEESWNLILRAYKTFVERFILSFRSSSSQEVYVRDPKQLSGSEEFIYDKLSILTQYAVRKLPPSSIPKSYSSRVKEGFELIEPLDISKKTFLEVRTGPGLSAQKFFIPLKITTQCFGDSGSIELTGVPVYRVTAQEERTCLSMDFRILEALVKGCREHVLLGEDALQAASHLSEKPWECDLFPR